MNKSQSGFTLIELVVVIVLLGILGVTALGKFQDLSGEAAQAAVEGVASEVSAASSVNYAKSLVGTAAVDISSTASGDNAITVDGTADACIISATPTDAGLHNLLAADKFPTGYTTTANTAADCSTAGAGSTYQCTITGDKAKTATATIVCSGA